MLSKLQRNHVGKFLYKRRLNESGEYIGIGEFVGKITDVLEDAAHKYIFVIKTANGTFENFPLSKFKYLFDNEWIVLKKLIQ